MYSFTPDTSLYFCNKILSCSFKFHHQEETRSLECLIFCFRNCLCSWIFLKKFFIFFLFFWNNCLRLEMLPYCRGKIHPSILLRLSFLGWWCCDSMSRGREKQHTGHRVFLSCQKLQLGYLYLLNSVQLFMCGSSLCCGEEAREQLLKETPSRAHLVQQTVQTSAILNNNGSWRVSFRNVAALKPHSCTLYCLLHNRVTDHFLFPLYGIREHLLSVMLAEMKLTGFKSMI